LIFMLRSGNNKHEHICQSLEKFAPTALPEFNAGDEVKQRCKQAELVPCAEQALARVAPADIPGVEPYGKRGGAQVATTCASDRGGTISIPAADPRQAAQ
jgi:hypothetical protein